MDYREAKRVRQACHNCRRKKTRCSGQRPTCTFCARLHQRCSYDNIAPPVIDNIDSNLQSTPSHIPPTTSGTEVALVMESSLANRIAIIESKLSMLNNSSMGTLVSKTLSIPPWPSSFHSSLLMPDPTSRQENYSCGDSADRLLLAGDEASRFSTIPPYPVVMSLTETYFRYCHCQPYAYFRENRFRKRLLDNALPKWLVLAFIATASRFSDDSFFQGRQEEAIESFANIAWCEIHKKIFSEDDFLSHHVVQAMGMLAVLDFTAGRNNRGWVKIGLAIRVAQALNLAAEPDSTLPGWLQDEYRGTFWSVYLLDRFVSCGPQRAPTIQDTDCTLKLGLDPIHCDKNSGPAVVSMEDLLTMPGSAAEVGQAGYLCLMASALGRIQRYCLRPSGQPHTYPPWDSRSEFASIRTTLMTFEAYSPLVWGDFDQAIIQLSPIREVLGFICFSYVLYFTNRCLLLHPFLLQQSILSWRGPVPRSFLYGCLLESHESATKFTDLLQHLLKARLCLTSFLGYCAVTAGVIHRLFQQHHDPSIQASSHNSYKKTLQFLRDVPAYRQHFSRMRQALADFNPDPEATAALVSPSLLAGMPPHPDANEMWTLLDYGWLSDQAKNMAAPLRQTMRQKDINLYNWLSITELEDPTQAWGGLNL